MQKLNLLYSANIETIQFQIRPIFIDLLTIQNVEINENINNYFIQTLSRINLKSDSIFCLFNGQQLFLRIGNSVSLDLINNLFGSQNISIINFHLSSSRQFFLNFKPIFH